MAEKKKRQLKKVETVREKAEKATHKEPKPRRLKRAGSAVAKPFGKARHLGRKEFHPVKLPDNKVGRFLTKRRRFIPKFFREAWAELREVTWPTRKETTKLTIAVFIFALVFGLIVALADYGLDKVFRSLFVK